MMQKPLRVIGLVVLSILVAGTGAVKAQQDDKSPEAGIRKALADWVVAANRRDQTAANTIWGPNVVGWFPRVPEFGTSAAFAVAGLPEKKDASYSTFELKIDEV